jgi:type IV pilus assembly protein PilQ
MTRRCGTAIVLALALSGKASPAAQALPRAPRTNAKQPEALVSLDVREKDVRVILDALAELGGVQIVYDPGVACLVTLNVTSLPIQKVLDATLRACSLASTRENDVLRVTTNARLAAEASERRSLDEARAQRPATRTTIVRLSYARAREMAPLLQRYLSATGKVTYDDRANILIIVD